MAVFLFSLRLFGLLSVGMGAVAWLPLFPRDRRLDLLGVVLLVVGGTLIYLLATWLERRLPPDKPKTYVLRNNDTRFIEQMIGQGRRIYLFLGLLFLAFTGLMVWAMIDDETQYAHPLIVMIFQVATLMLLGA